MKHLFSLGTFVLLALWIGVAHTSAQTTFKKELPTGKVNKKVQDQKNPQIPKQKKISYIYVYLRDNEKDIKRMLIGNPCAIDYTRSMGFIYEVWHRKDTRYGSTMARYWNNTKIKSKLILTRGPWWRLKVKKRFKECARQSGDYTG